MIVATPAHFATNVIASISALQPDDGHRTKLLGVELIVARSGHYNLSVVRAEDGTAVCSAERYGFAWAGLGKPERDLPYVVGFDESDCEWRNSEPLALRVPGHVLVESLYRDRA